MGAEIKHHSLDLIDLLLHKDVGWFDVPLGEVQAMDACEGSRDLSTGLTHAPDQLVLVGDGCDKAIEGHALGHLHREEQVPLVGTRIEDLDHSGDTESTEASDLGSKRL